MYVVCLNCPEVENTIFKINTYILRFLIKNYNSFGSGVMKFLFSEPYGFDIPNLVKIGTVVLEKKISTDAKP